MTYTEDTTRKLQAAAAACSGVIGTIAIIVLLHMGLLPLGVPGQWMWRPRPAPVVFAHWRGVAALVGGCAVLILLAALLLDAVRRERVARHAHVLLALVAVASPALPLISLGADSGGWYRAVIAVCGDLSMGYLGEASTITDVRSWLASTTHRVSRRRVASRVATHPPGPVLFYWTLLHLAKHNPVVWSLGARCLPRDHDEIGQLVPVLRVVSCGRLGDPIHAQVAALSVYLLLAALPAIAVGAWLLARAVLSVRAALVAGLLAVLIPSFHCFVPSIDAWAAALAVLACGLWAAGARQSRPFHGLLAGVVWGLGLQWTYGLAALLVPIAVLSLLFRPRPVVLLAGVAGVILAHVPLSAIGYNPVANFIGSMAAHRSIMASRDYLAWLVFNAWDIVLFAGPCLVALAACAARDDRTATLPAVALLAVLFAMGATRGEVGRIWGFAMPLLAVVAAGVLTRLRGRQVVLFGTLVAASQVALTLALTFSLTLVAP